VDDGSLIGLGTVSAHSNELREVLSPVSPHTPLAAFFLYPILRQTL
jgi:hypothetical protein